MKLFKGLSDCFNKRKTLIVIFASIYLVGIILGGILPKQFEKDYFYDNALELFVNTLFNGGNPFTLILNRLFVDIFCLILFYVLSISCYLLFANAFVIFYKGYLLGAIAIALISGFGFTGFVLFLLVVFIENVISTSALIFLTVMPCDFKRNKNKRIDQSRRLDYFLIACAVTVMGIFLQILTLFLFLRPMNYVT